MRRRHVFAAGLPLATLLAAAGACTAADYRIEFDTWPHAHSLSVTIGDYHYSDPAQPRFRTWGSAWSNQYPRGSRVTLGDEKGRRLVSVHVRARDPRDTFNVDASSAGALFREVWVRKQGGKLVEAVFTGAAVPNNSSLWNLVKPGTPTNPYNNFQGYWSDKKITPTGGGWEQIYPAKPKTTGKQDERWEGLLAACPNEYRNIRVYGQLDDKSVIAFLAEGRLLVYDHGTKNIRSPATPGAIPTGVNRITLEKGKEGLEVLLWLNGEVLARVPLRELSTSTLVGTVPETGELRD